jgi:hypothetical protein
MLLSVRGKVLNRVLLEKMKEEVDPMLQDQQAGFRRNRSCVNQIASVCIIVEQSPEWNSPIYVNFIHYEKAFDRVDRGALWKLQERLPADQQKHNNAFNSNVKFVLLYGYETW